MEVCWLWKGDYNRGIRDYIIRILLECEVDGYLSIRLRRASKKTSLWHFVLTSLRI